MQISYLESMPLWSHYWFMHVQRRKERNKNKKTHGMLQVQAVGVELGNGRGGDDAAGGQARVLDEVEGVQEGAAEGARLAVVGRRGDGEQVDLRRGLGDGDGAAGVLVTCLDGHGEERLALGRWGCCHGRRECLCLSVYIDNVSSR